MVLDFPATGDNYDEMLVVMIQASSSVALSPFSSSSHPFHSQFHRNQYIAFLFSGDCAIWKYVLFLRTNTVDSWTQIQTKRKQI